ncbi:MAG: hypothetical protein KUG54_01430 [Gammaproteobacteria bacterium]|nr:hypothetical protein [Gammaproteobacteria bacterium]
MLFSITLTAPDFDRDCYLEVAGLVFKMEIETVEFKGLLKKGRSELKVLGIQLFDGNSSTVVLD